MATAVSVTRTRPRAGALGDVLVRRKGEELDEVARLVPPSAAVRLRADEVPDLRELLALDGAHEIACDRGPAAAHRRAVADPLPDLRAADLARRRVLHQVVDRGRAVPAQ